MRDRDRLLWQTHGNYKEADDLLPPVHAWFTERFDTADLQKVRLLLNELKG